MGILFSKNEKAKEFVSPKKFYDEMSGILDSDDDFLQNIDPRSPCSNISRTPVSEINLESSNKEVVTRVCDLTSEFDTPQKPYENNPNLKDKLLKKLGYNLNDPRSPSHVINRTPIVVNNKTENGVELTENSVPSVEFHEIQEEMASFKSTLETLYHDINDSLNEFHNDDGHDSGNGTSNVNEHNFTPKIDPRSPSIGIERTPLLFKQNLSSTSDEDDHSHVDEEINKMVNELISDIKNYTKKSIKNRTEDIIEEKQEELVYEELKDVKYSTPKGNIIPTNNFEGNRTPLSCVGNRKPMKLHNKVIGTGIRKPFGSSSTSLKKQNDENTPEMNGNINSNFSSITKSAKSRIPVSHRNVN